ncbi:hypothetical protein [Labedaea rhizosphaerae]|uniref:Uncharacterized protein n=1 Tax=Labedaea rhizosphaerae TaxID=598644 RepID=A0A4V3CXJ7_LABRH|nr:hypothetical protein [Labedaea rhizosphaerae]TDP90528.1 hypothetical protein EV186_11068 [Labedaea rhizosphaerae]
MTAATNAKPTTKKARKAIDWPAVMYRAARHGGLQIVDLDFDQWNAAFGPGDARVVVDGQVIWMSPKARPADLETALLEMDHVSHKNCQRPDDVVEIGSPTSGYVTRSIELRRTPRVSIPELDWTSK